jgi:hypothetical protein
MAHSEERSSVRLAVECAKKTTQKCLSDLPDFLCVGSRDAVRSLSKGWPTQTESCLSLCVNRSSKFRADLVNIGRVQVTIQHIYFYGTEEVMTWIKNLMLKLSVRTAHKRGRTGSPTFGRKF